VSKSKNEGFRCNTSSWIEEHFCRQLPAGRVLGQWVRELNPAHPERTAPAILAEEAEEVRLYECIGAT
jgi:hypothetical protein